jgi:hypothetical protein
VYLHNQNAANASIKIRLTPDFLKTYTWEENYRRIVNDENEMRKPEGLNYSSKAPIIIFGCSFAFGDALEKNQTLSYKLAKYLHRPVYNRASCSWGLQQMLYQLKNGDVFKLCKKAPDTVLYVFMEQHIGRMYKSTYTFPFNNLLFLRYKYDDKLQDFVEIKPLIPFFDRTAIATSINEYNEIHNWSEYKNFDKNFDLMKKYFEKSREEMQKVWGKNFKFVILKYDEGDNSKYISSERWKELEDEGFIVLNTTDLVGRVLNQTEDLAFDNFHPAEKVWDMLIPKIVKEIGLK